MRLLFIPEGNGLHVAFENVRGRYWSWFNNPPQSISHVDRYYLRGRFPNVRDKRQVEFIKREWSKFMQHKIQLSEQSILRKGDKVVMHTCIEARFYEGKIWTVTSEPWTLCHSEVVMLEGFSGAFATEYLQRVQVEETV